MGKRLSKNQISSYERDGFVFPVAALPREDFRRLSERYLELEQRGAGRTDRGGRDWILRPHRTQFWAYEMASHPQLLDAVEDIIGPNVLLLDVKFFPKMPHSTTHVTWHQDQTYTPFEPSNKVVTAWLALTDSTRENGCMRMISGSHRGGQLAHKTTFADDNLLKRGQVIEDSVDEGRAVDMVMRAGEASLHHSLTVHCSGPNQTNERRVGVMILYIAPEVIQSGGDRYPAMLVRGSDPGGHFEIIDPPAD